LLETAPGATISEKFRKICAYLTFGGAADHPPQLASVPNIAARWSSNAERCQWVGDFS
jgi:hypothetical protein